MRRSVAAAGSFRTRMTQAILTFELASWHKRRERTQTQLSVQLPPAPTGIQAAFICTNLGGADRRWGKPLKHSFADVRNSHADGKPSRKIYIRPPNELGLGKGTLMRLDQCMYGCRDSSPTWEDVYTQTLTSMGGFMQGAASPC